MQQDYEWFVAHPGVLEYDRPFIPDEQLPGVDENFTTVHVLLISGQRMRMFK